MSRRRAKGVVEVDRTLVVLLVVAEIALFMLWLILGFVVKYPIFTPAGGVLMAFFVVLAVLVKIAPHR